MNSSLSRCAILVVLSALMAAGVSACAGAARTAAVVVMGPWVGDKPGDEGYAFRKVLDAFTDKTRIRYDYKETRALPQVLASQVQAGTPPDVALLSGVGDMVRYARNGRLFPLDDVVDGAQRRLPPSWQVAQKVDGANHIFAVPVKVNLKSMIWYQTGPRAPRGVTTWDGLLDYSASVARTGVAPWCMGLSDGASSGWPATDFIEDILLRMSGVAAYEQWATGDLPWTSTAVTEAWHEWGRIVTTKDFVSGGAQGAVLTDFADTRRSMFGKDAGCLLEHQASFMMGEYRKSLAETTSDDGIDFMPFPAFEEHGAVDPPVVASADFAGMFDDTPEARQLMNFLATDEAQKIWPRIPGSGAFTVNAGVHPDLYEDRISKRVATAVRDAKAICLDASDIMPATMRNAFYRATLDYVDNPASLPSLLKGLEQVRVDIPDEDWFAGFSCAR